MRERPPRRGIFADAAVQPARLLWLTRLTSWRKGFLHQLLQQCGSTRVHGVSYSAQRRRTEGQLAARLLHQAFRSLAICLQKLPECPQRALLPGGTPSRIRQIHFFLDLGKTGWRC